MRRILLCMFLILVVTCSLGTSFANANQGIYESIVPYYESVLQAKTTFKITSGIAQSKLDIKVLENKNIDKVIADIRIVNHKTGNVIKTWSGIRFSKLLNTNNYSVIKKYSLTSRGSYHVSATIKVYSGSKLMDTIRINSLPATY